jgi:hypothetical protein
MEDGGNMVNRLLRLTAAVALAAALSLVPLAGAGSDARLQKVRHVCFIIHTFLQSAQLPFQ